MYIDFENEKYELLIQHVQIEVTGYCNMNCKHCRAANETKRNMSLEQIEKILKIINKVRDDDFRLILSGGEPFLHPKILEILKLIKKYNIESVVITTNASLVDDKILKAMNDLKFKFLCIQVSLDSLDEETHDNFRRYKGAYQKCIETLNKIQNYDNIYSSIRMTLTKETINEIEKMIDFSIQHHVKILGIGSVIPFGNAKSKVLCLTPQQKKDFLEKLAVEHKKYNDKIDITTEDPLKFLVNGSPWQYTDNTSEVDDSFFGGCTAGITTFNVSSDGDITPCAMIEEKILNINNYGSIDDILNSYSNSLLIKKLFSRKFSGKCGNCKNKRICGGCRAVAKGYTKDLMGSDLSCWSGLL